MIISLPGSKSITNRALLIAALANGVSELKGLLFADDTEALLALLTELKIKVELDPQNKSCRIEGCNGKFPVEAASLWCHDAGTVLRFVLAACAAMPGNFFIDGSRQLQKRPIKTLINALQAQGAIFDSECLPCTVSNTDKLIGGHINVPASESSQFLSGLLMVAPFAATPVTIFSDETKSMSYINMTCKVMTDFGVNVLHKSEREYFIPQQSYQARQYQIEPDLSTASYFFAGAALLNQSITIKNIQQHATSQGDVEFLKILKAMGCMVQDTATGIELQGTTKLKGVTVNMQDCSDTFMTLACLAPFADSPTTITGIGHTRFKECDRIAAVKNNLERLGIQVIAPDRDSLIIFPGVPKTAQLQSYHDHRIVMAFAVIGLKIPEIVMDNIACVKKTCPEFFALWKKFAGSFDLVNYGCA
jgi:3-phosphoshikimate 1-carboxyvinyltransferase